MDSIFVSIASYRDLQTGPTIADLINKAAHPDNITIGLCLQHDNNEITIDEQYKKYTKTIEYNWRESQGTCWARHNIQKLLFDNEKYYLQLDSHHRFCSNWDTKLISMIERLKEVSSNKPIIGGYCPGYKPDNDSYLEDKPMQINCFPDFTDLGDLMFIPKTIRDFEKLQTNQQHTIPARFLSGHFIFTNGNFCNDCPYDPNLYFRGEELSLSARAYTSGYDFYHPTSPIVWHEYTRERQKKHWDDHTTENGFLTPWNIRSDKGKARTRYLLGIEKNTTINFGKYGLGKDRSLHEYELYAGLKFSTKQVHKYAHDINNTYPYAQVLDEKEWTEGLMPKYKIQLNIPDNYISEFKQLTNIKHISLICDNNKGKCCYRKDLKNKDLQYLASKYYIEASMEADPKTIHLIPCSRETGFLNKYTINNFTILP